MLFKGNGLGPRWFPAWLRKSITALGALFFDEAAWVKHDAGYAEGGTEKRRAYSDMRFLQAMLRDASRTTTIFRVFMSTVLAWSFWLAVRLGGWTVFNYENRNLK